MTGEHMRVSIRLAILSFTLIMAPACKASLAASVSCEGMRSLRIGMSKEEVRAAIGELKRTGNLGERLV